MKTCLVVDDSSVIRKVARRILEGLEFQIVEAENGEEAIVSCQTQMPDAILLDWNMPVMNGFDMLKELRAEGYDGIKVLMVTTEAENDYILRALDAGADEYLMKPFDGEALAEKLAMLGFAEA